MYYSPQLKV